MATIIPIKDNPNHTLLIELESRIYKFYFLYNELGGCWAFTIYDDKDNVIVAGVKIVPNYPLLYAYTDINLFSGDIYCEISDIKGVINRDSFLRGTAILLYLTPTEIELIG